MKPTEIKAAEEMWRRQELENQPVIMDDEDAAKAQIQRERMKIAEHFMRGLRHLAVQKGVRCLNFDCYLLAIGQGRIIGMFAAADVAKIYHVTKAAATECVDDFQKALGLPPMPGQRSVEGRKKMTKTRLSQLKK